VAASIAVTSAAAGTVAASRFDDGTYRVGYGMGEVHPGTYRAPGGSDCYWARLKNFSGSLNAIAANDNPAGPALVTILKRDRGFTTHDCRGWSSSLKRITKSKTKFGTGTYLVRTDILPGTYRSRGGSNCYWARLRNFTGDLNGIVANDNPTGPAIVTIGARDKGFTSHDCGTWSRF